MNKKLYLEWLQDAQELGIDNLTDADRLHSISKSLHRSYENRCNYQISQRQETRESNLEKEAEAIAKKYGLNIFFQSDPRGWPIYLSKENLASSNYSSYPSKAIPPR